MAGREEDGEELVGDCRWKGSYGPKKRLKGQDDLLSAFLYLFFFFSHHPFLSCWSFQHLIGGEGERNSSFKFPVKLFVLLCQNAALFPQTWENIDKIGHVYPVYCQICTKDLL